MNGVRDLSLSHLDTKYAKIDNKNGIKMKNWVRNTWVEKSQRSTLKSQRKKSMINTEKSTQKVNGQPLVKVNGQQV